MHRQNDFSLLAQHNLAIFSEQEARLLSNLKQQWLKKPSLAGVKILHNIPLTYETLVKLESLLAAGAELTVTHTKFLPIPPEPSIVSLLAQLGIPFIADHADVQGEFDIALDCCAEVLDMKKITIKKGIVELTQSGGERYKRIPLPFPVINVDDSNLKKLEGMYGTGEGFIRAIKEKTKQNITHQSFVVFGFGKVGHGIVKYLLKETSQITVIDPSWERLEKAKNLGVQTLHTSHSDTIKDCVKEAFCIVTATGKANVLSQFLTQEDCKHAYLANMGADDEIGEHFNGENVLCQRMAINFSLKHPTLLHFIDPIFYAHNLSAQLLLENNYASGYHAFPAYLDDLIIQLWNAYYPIDISDIFN
ncbi:NAD(P)-dependent oxidoreductase [Legionella oakridgensis]|uniref:S-adenosylhomocysteine hydrolase n=2 Tax=Legionella oakridgensis TaxID=29423 RepID=W0BFR1_9GAMM|nr:NAD(P)-dependent oxidoreductase [Legionella oakridgensis]AHE67467.1 S-adenosylhomocysteine hydrolase [Legionella oakridgensis ATCC 33761 = DSM 21215]ETO92997.1 adenosylhomocysteinase [Legionella oakridgensis RV-2-2007]KTD43525.1 adenosylhomocysteinase [Legionella oakridgensis]STY20517.1 adenosylhomocysteinase [Legionella longbeachae]